MMTAAVDDVLTEIGADEVEILATAEPPPFPLDARAQPD